jgi:tetratricopeptide (TPR) repeat protein
MLRQVCHAVIALSLVGGAVPSVAAQYRDSLTGRKNSRSARRPRTHSRAGRLIVSGTRKGSAGEWTAAIADFEKATRISAASANAFFHLADAYFHRAFLASQPDKGDCELALEAYDTSEALDPSLRTLKDPFLLYHGQAQCYEAIGSLPKALDAIKQAAKIARRNPMPHLYGARIRYKMQDFAMSQANLYYSVRRARRMKMYPQLVKMIKENAHFKGLLTVPRNKIIIEAYDAVHQGTLTEAEAKERIRGFQPYRDALTNTAAKTPTLSTPKAKGDPRDPDVRRFIEEGDRAIKHTRYRQAIGAYQDALAADAQKGTLDEVNQSIVLGKIGDAYRKLGLAGEAVRMLRHAVKTMPANSDAHYQLSLSYAMNGEVGNALTALNKALDTAVTVPQLRQTLLLARTDTELSAIRDTKKFQAIIRSHSTKFRAKR